MDKEVPAFPKVVCLKVNVKVYLEFELTMMSQSSTLATTMSQSSTLAIKHHPEKNVINDC